MPFWSPELELIARLSRIAPSPEDQSRAGQLAGGPLDWARFLSLTSHHGVAPLVHANLSRVAEAPVHIRERVRQMRLASVRGDLALYTPWLELCSAFDERGIPALTLKGFHAVLSIYGQVGLRPVGDLDFLVRRGDVSAAIGLLEGMGYALFPEWQAALRHVGLDHVLNSTHEIALVSERGAVVDLHWEAGPPGTMPSGESLIAGAERLRVDDRWVLVPPRDAATAILLLHGHISAWARLRWLVDVAEGMDRLSASEYESTARRLDALGMRRALANALQLIERLWGRLPAPCVAGKRHEDAVHPLTLHYGELALEREQDWPHVFDLWRPVRMLWDRAGRARSLPSAVAEALRPNRLDWAAVSLPRPLRVGYYAVRPLRIVGQAVAKGTRKVGNARTPARNPDARPSVPLTFVTAIYDSGLSSVLGGRGWGVDYYLPSLINIANLGAPIVVYSPRRDAAAVEQAIAPYFAEYRVVPFELAQFEYFERFIAWKETYWKSLEINNRNEVLCFLKSYWVQDATAATHFGHDHFFWIDAGLGHHGLFPEKVGGVELRTSPPASHYHPANPANIFTPTLGNALAHAAPEGRVFFCALPFNRHHERTAVYEAVTAATFNRPAGQVHIQEHLVGGLFGGRARDLQAVHRLYVELLKALIGTKTYTLEEQVFSSLNAIHPELFSLRRFQTWWFHSPGEPNSRLDAEGDSFYKIFAELAARRGSR